MRARVFDKQKGKYYISEVYGIVNRAGDWYIVHCIDRQEQLCLVEYLDVSAKDLPVVNVEGIDANPVKDWIDVADSRLDAINARLVSSKKVYSFKGYKRIWECPDAIVELLETGITSKDFPELFALSTKLPGWNYIESQADIEKLLDAYAGFHDTVIQEVSYLSGDYFEKATKSMCFSPAASKQVKVVFNSYDAGKLEMVLLAPRVVHIVPAEENAVSLLYDASVFLKDCKVYFYDSFVDYAPENYEGMYFVSMGIRWRIILK